MASVLERHCTMLINADMSSGGGGSGGGSGMDDVADLRKQLESRELGEKMDALKKLLLLHLNGEKMDGMLMAVIQYVLPHEDAHLRKLGLYFLETVDKKGPDGAMLPEMILVVNMIRNDLVHANEYTRGSALRFCCKLNDAELLEPLVPSVRANLEHRHSYVRRNAVLAVHFIFDQFEYLIPDAPELIDEFLRAESDLACRRNALAMLVATDEPRAVAYLHENIQQVPLWSETLQLLSLELIRQVCRASPAEKGKYIQIIFALLASPSAAVVYQSATTLIALSATPTAIRASAQSFCSLLATQSDNNIKLIMLDRLLELKKAHAHVLQELVMDVLRALSSPNMELRRKSLNLAMDLITNRNVEEVVTVLKKELQKSSQTGSDQSDWAAVGAYRQLLVKSLHTIALKFKHVVGTVVAMLGDYVDDEQGVGTAADVVVFFREVCELFPKMRADVLSRLLQALNSRALVSSYSVVRGVMWILSEYSASPAEVRDSFTAIVKLIAPLPLRADTAQPEEAEEEESGPSSMAATKKPVVLADGTYASQTADESLTETGSSVPKLASKSGVREAILVSGDYFLGVAVCSSLCKLALRLGFIEGAPVELVNKVKAEAMLASASLATFGRSTAAPATIDEGSVTRLIGCIRALNGDLKADLVLASSRDAFSSLMDEKRQKDQRIAREQAEKNQVGVEELVQFELLRSRRVAGGVEDIGGGGGSDEMVAALLGEGNVAASNGAKRQTAFSLDRIVQLTGMSDPLYAEAQVIVRSFDVFLDVLVINKSSDTLQAVTIEWATMGDLKLCERPPSLTLAPGDQKSVRTNIKVSSTDTGIIFGNVVFDVAGGAGGQSGCVILNDIHIDIMDYIRPGEVSDTAFRSMWAEFEWENKVAINTAMTDLSAYLDYILASTNMKCLTLRGMENESGFLAANLYATSVFNEDALVNVSAEKAKDGSLEGYVRIRSKTQGIALSLGDKITLKQAQFQA